MKALTPPLALAIALVLPACGGSDPAPEADKSPGAVEAAAAGAAGVVKNAAQGSPIPRDNLPEFVETYSGGRYGTSFFASNAKQRSGTLLYQAPAAPADVTAFHVSSMEKFGFSVAAPQTKVVRKRNETVIKGVHADGSTLSAVVIEQSPTEATVQMNYVVPIS